LTEYGAFSLEQASKLSGTSARQLEYWDETGFFQPQYATENRHRPYSRVYSYRDIVGLRTLAILRNEHHVPLQTLRVVNEWLKRNYATPWSDDGSLERAQQRDRIIGATWRQSEQGVDPLLCLAYLTEQ
jgi:DNA-binding transcriptional MerR regulator